MHRLTHFLFFHLINLVLLIFFEPKHAQTKEKNREGKQNKTEKEGRSHPQQEGRRPTSHHPESSKLLCWVRTSNSPSSSSSDSNSVLLFYSTSAILIPILARIVVTVSKKSSLVRVEIGHSFLEERPKLQFRTVRVLIP
ncbi:uncharacterized protein DS421_15g495960 [Arachis hypogaea]|nr:uncharacterized protein DS421_15g495960 [Arachis hypogaea]